MMPFRCGRTATQKNHSSLPNSSLELPYNWALLPCVLHRAAHLISFFQSTITFISFTKQSASWDKMFKRLRRSMREGNASSRNDGVSHHVCHECGQSLRDTIDTYEDKITAGRFNSDRANKRDSWNGSSDSDSGYGSSRHSELEAQLDLGHDAPAPSLSLPLRRPTYNSSIYSETSTFEQTPRQQIIVEQAQVDAPVYDHHFELPPRTFTNYSDKWKPKSRYSRLNELPAASPRAMAFPDDALAVNSGAEKESDSSEKKRLSLVLRPSSLRRLTARRSKSQ